MTNPTRQKQSVERPSAKGCGMRASGARPWPCQRRCGKWKYGKTRIPRLEGAEADLHVSLFLRVERKVEVVFIAWRYEQI